MRTFCIVLRESPERTESAKAHFVSVGLRDVTWFNGIHAEKMGIKTIYPYELDNPGSGFNIGFKPIGIWLSHYMLWNALTLLADDHFLVLESDAQFAPDWEQRTLAALRAIPIDFDMLYIGSCCCQGREKQLIGGEVYKVSGGAPLCTHAYIVTRKALETLMASQPRLYAPVDISMALHSHPLLKVFTLLPRAVTQFNTVIGE